MTDLIPRDAALKTYTDWTIGPEEAIAKLRAIPTIDPAAIREAAMRGAAAECQRIAGNTKDFIADHRRAAGQCAAMILALIGEKK